MLLPIGNVIATASQLLLLVPFIYKNGYKYEPVLDRNDEYIKIMSYMVLPIIFGVSINQINVLVDELWLQILR